MEQNEEHERVLILVIQSSRISSLKSLFFPMEYRFYDTNGGLSIVKITKNWIGQKTEHKTTGVFFLAKGIFLRRLSFHSDLDTYGLFWAGSVRKAKRIVEQYVPVSRRLRWSDTWF